MPDDQTTGKVQHHQVGISPFFPTDQQASIPIEPTMRSFHHPASRSRPFSWRLGLVSTPPNPRHHPDPPDMLIHTAPDIAQIQTQPGARRLPRPINHDLGQGFFQQHAVMPMGASNHQRQRQTLPVSEQAALDTPFASVGRVGADFFPHPAGPWSSCHPAPASPSQSFRAPRTPVIRPARSAQTPRRRSIRESAGGPTNANTTPWHPVRPTACRCAATAGSHPSRPGPGCAVDGSPADGAWAAESMVPSVPTLHRSSASHHRVANSSPCPRNRKSCSLDKQTNRCFTLAR
jgi:hypothetical protein